MAFVCVDFVVVYRICAKQFVINFRLLYACAESFLFFFVVWCLFLLIFLHVAVTVLDFAYCRVGGIVRDEKYKFDLLKCITPGPLLFVNFFSLKTIQ